MDPQTQALLDSLRWVRPELLLAGFALLAAPVGAFLGDRAGGVLSVLCAGVLAAAGALAFFDSAPAESVTEAFGGALRIDAFSGFAKLLIGGTAAVTLLLAVETFGRDREMRFEYPVLVALAALGFFVMASANDLIALYIGIELQSIASYALAAFRRDDARSSEAGLKYFVLGALSSGFLLYGASLIYGFAGSVRFDVIAANLESGPGMIFGLVFLLCGLAFKMSAAPFHMWTPDVYEGAPTPVTAMFAAAPKIAAVTLMARVLYGPFLEMTDQWRQVVIALAALSLVIGAFAALAQNNIKRLMAYSSIANMGFVLMALAAGTERGAAAALLYLAFYLPATIGTFAVIAVMRRDGRAVERIDDLAGLARRQPLLATALTALMFSLTGIPPLIGFFGKYYAFVAALDAGLWPLALVGGLATVVGAGYYLRIVKVMWFDAAAPAFERAGGIAVGAAVTAFALTLALLPVLGAIEAAATAAAAASFLAP